MICDYTSVSEAGGLIQATRPGGNLGNSDSGFGALRQKSGQFGEPSGRLEYWKFRFTAAKKAISLSGSSPHRGGGIRRSPKKHA